MKFIILAAAGLASANLLSLNDKAAGNCNTICKPVMELSSDCGSDLNCVCNNESFDVQVVGGACQSCLEQAKTPNDSIEKLAVACQFEAVSYSPSLTILAQGINVDAKMTAPANAAATATSGMTMTMMTGSMASMGAGMTMTITSKGMTITSVMAATGTSISGMSIGSANNLKGGVAAGLAVAGSLFAGFAYALV